MRTTLALVGMMVTGLASAAPAAVTEDQFPPRTTRDLVALCSATANDPMRTAAQNFCHGFAEGAVAVQQEYQAASPRHRLFCLPDPPPSREQSLASLVRWANAHPEHMGEKPADGLFHFLMDAYPCPAAEPASRSRRPAR